LQRFAARELRQTVCGLLFATGLQREAATNCLQRFAVGHASQTKPAASQTGKVANCLESVGSW
jgi:hypothetical protein